MNEFERRLRRLEERGGDEEQPHSPDPATAQFLDELARRKASGDPAEVWAVQQEIRRLVRANEEDEK